MNPPKMPNALHSDENMKQQQSVPENTILLVHNEMINNSGDVSSTKHGTSVIEHDPTISFLESHQKTEGFKSLPYAPAPRVILGTDDVTLPLGYDINIPLDFMPTNLDLERIPAEYCGLCQQLEPFRLFLSIDELISPSQVSRTFRRDESIPRPQNAFIIYRRNLVASLKEKGGDIRVRDISDEASESWRKERQEVKQFFKCLAVMGKIVHSQKWPGYIYKPKRKVKEQQDGGTGISGDEACGDDDDESEEIECLNAMVNECCNIMSDHNKKDMLYDALSKQMKRLRKRQQKKRANRLLSKGRKKRAVVVNKNNRIDYDTGWNNIESIEGMENGGASGDGRNADESHDNIEPSCSHYDCPIPDLNCDPNDTSVVNALDEVQTNNIEDYGLVLDLPSNYSWVYPTIPAWSGNEGVPGLLSENVCSNANERTEECISTVNGYNGIYVPPGCDIL